MNLFPEGDAQRKNILQDIQRWEHFIALDKKLPGVLKSDVLPADAPEWIQLAQLCQLYRKQYAAAARFYAKAFEEKPDFAKDQNRYNAACAAALAGCGKGSDADKLDDKDLVRLRNQSRAWLRADLEAWAKLAYQGKPDARAAAVQALRHWQTDPDLAGVRDKEALAILPEAERELWRKLWADVAEMLGKVKESKK